MVPRFPTLRENVSLPQLTTAKEGVDEIVADGMPNANRMDATDVIHTRETDGRVNMIGEGGVGTGTYSAESNLPGATCVGIADGGACMNGEGRTGIGTDLAKLNLH